MILDCSEGNVPFYERCGFQDCGNTYIEDARTPAHYAASEPAARACSAPSNAFAGLMDSSDESSEEESSEED